MASTMLRIILSGCNGRMGHVISELVSERDDFVIVAGFDLRNDMKEIYPVYNDIALFDGNADVIIDFSHPSFLTNILEFSQKRSFPIVLATTGLAEEQIELVRNASSNTAIFMSANMSLGISLVTELAKKAASVLSESFDIEIIEKHHNQKLDAPSGTSLMIANEISSVTKWEAKYNYDRHLQRAKREKNEIGLHSVRGGTIVGEHEVIFAGSDEIVTITHSAMSKRIFAVGALSAAKFIFGKNPGLYSMKDLVNQ